VEPENFLRAPPLFWLNSLYKYD